jgi:hypothetical protein
MKCNDCIFRQPIFDAAFLNDRGEPVPVYRCQVMPEFHMLTSIFCNYTLNTAKFYEDVGKLDLNYLQQLASQKVINSLEDYDSKITSVKLEPTEVEFLISLLEVPKNPAKKRAHIVTRLKTLDDKVGLRLTVAECIYLISQIHASGAEITSKWSPTVFKLQAQLGCL